MKCPHGHDAHLRSPDYGRGSEWVCYTCNVYGFVFSSNTPGVDAEQALRESNAARSASRVNAENHKKKLMARKENPTTRFYQIKPGKSGWARMWITDDGCISIMSDWGNYGYWFGSPGCEFRRFLTECDDGYLGNKFSGGKTEFDGEGTVEAIRDRILQLRRDLRLTKSEARREWDGLPNCFDTPEDFSCWVRETKLDDMYEYSSYVMPSAVRHFLKRAWPLLVEQLKAELAEEQTAQVASAP